MSDTPRYISIKQAAEIIPGMTEGAIYKRVQRREIPSYTIGRRRLLKSDEFIRWVESHRVEPFDPHNPRGAP